LGQEKPNRVAAFPAPTTVCKSKGANAWSIPRLHWTGVPAGLAECASPKSKFKLEELFLFLNFCFLVCQAAVVQRDSGRKQSVPRQFQKSLASEHRLTTKGRKNE